MINAIAKELEKIVQVFKAGKKDIIIMFERNEKEKQVIRACDKKFLVECIVTLFDELPTLDRIVVSNILDELVKERLKDIIEKCDNEKEGDE